MVRATEVERPVDRSRQDLLDQLGDRLARKEQVIAMLPFASVPKRAKGPEGKVTTGIRQSWRRYRPLVLTDRRLFVFESGRTPHPRGVLVEFPVAAVHFVETRPARFGQQALVLDLPGLGPVPFEVGRLEHDDLAALRRFFDVASHEL